MSIKLKGSTDGSVSLDAPSDTSPTGTDVSFTLPAADGTSGQVLTTNGSGSLSFANEGKILQAVSTTKTDVFSSSHSGHAEETSDVTGLTVSITPTSTNSKILITGFISLGTDSSVEHIVAYRLYRGSTSISIGDSSGTLSRVTGSVNFGDGGNRAPGVAAINFLDSPSTTSTVTYAIRLVNLYATTITLYVNRGGDTLDSPSRARTTSTITAMEVAA